MDGQTLQAVSGELAALTATAGGVVVAVEGRETRASGFVWRPGWVVTADEALGEDDGYSVTLADGTTVAARLRGRDASTDVALLKLEGDGGQAVTASAVAQAGALALALGRAEGLDLAGLRLGADFITEFWDRVPDPQAPHRDIPQEALGCGAGLWLRSEPGEDAAQADALAAIVAMGLADERPA